MKHIKKRFLIETSSDKLKFKDGEKIEKINVKGGITPKDFKNKKDWVAFIETDSGEIFGGFFHKAHGKNLVIPVPDPTLVYFNNAQLSVQHIKESRKKLYEKIDIKSLNEPALNEIYNYYGLTSGFVIFLFTAIESFINQMIPENYNYINLLNRKTEVYNKDQIQEFLDFKTKIKDVLKDVSGGKDFFRHSTPANQIIWNLKEFRDDVIHTKQKDPILKYEELFKTSINFKYDKALEAVAKFMNFYKDGYIIECDCGRIF